jgi:LysM repeat protein
LRPDIPQKIAGAAPSNSNEDRSPLVDTRAFVTSEVSRHSCNAAMLGVALSVGACGGLMLPSLNAVAQTSDPVAAGATSTQQPAESTANQPSSASKIAFVTPNGNTASNPTTPNAASLADPTVAKPAVGKSVSENGHTVRAGDSLWRIAKNYGVDIATLANLNQLQPDTKLKVGQVLQLPTSISRNNTTGNGVASNDGSGSGVTSLQAIAQSVPEVPVIASQDDLKTQQARSIDLLKEKRNQLQQRLAELGEESKISNVPTATSLPGTSTSSASETADASLPVTTLSKTPLPAIGGEAPKAIALNPVVTTEKVGETASEQKTTSLDTSSLLSEIQEIRNRYQRQTAPYGTQSGASQLVTSQAVAAKPADAKPADTVVPTTATVNQTVNQTIATTASTVVPTTRLEASAAPLVNPDFNGRKSDSSLSIELRNFVQPKLKPEDTGAKVMASPTQQRQVIARATLGSEAYAPVAPTVKRMVAPNLPSIGREDAYLPGGIDASNGYVWPAQGMLSSGYGWRWGRMHRGLTLLPQLGLRSSLPLVVWLAMRVGMMEATATSSKSSMLMAP